MEIYLVYKDKKKIKQYKTFDEAMKFIENLQILNSNIKIVMEEYCDDNYFDSCCKTFILYEHNI